MQSLLGKTIHDRYVLHELLGEGNFGAVFKGSQLFLGTPVRTVALKVCKHINMDIPTATTIFAEAFLLARALQEMTDPQARQHLVHLYDMGILPEEDNRGFIVMEYIRGTTLAAQFASFGRIPATLVVQWILQICRALQGLHELIPPILHRDLKPDNILIGLDHVLRVVDFGLAARLMDCGFTEGVTGALSYMAPETMMGESIPASDVFSIGIMLYEGLTSKHPFAHLISALDPFKPVTREWLYKQMHSYHPPAPSSLNNTVPAALDMVVLRCLEFYPNRRYYNAGALLQALTKIHNVLSAK